MPKANITEIPIIWLHAATCTGCSVSMLNSVSPTIKNLLIDEVIPGKHLNLRFQATVMAGAGDMVISEMEKTWQAKKGGYVLVVEGSVPTAQNGVFGAIGEKNEKPVSIAHRVEVLGKDAMAIIALGTCASYGGIFAGKPNPTGCMGLGQFYRQNKINTPLVNVPGCPPHPDWFVGTVASILLFGLPKAKDLDEVGRPKAFYGQQVHENCPRRAYFDEGKFARKFGDPGCLNELGCKGPVSYADCPSRRWNNAVSWCIGAGSPCLGCVEPGFPDLLAPMYVKLTGEAIPNLGQKPK